MMRILFVVTALFSVFSGAAQIRGVVTDGASGKPLQNANIFISNTSKGTVSGAEGHFELLQIPAGKYDLIISMVGYQTVVQPFETARLPLNLKVKMEIKVKQQEDATVAAFENNGWQRWGRLFTGLFMGAGANAAECTIVNHDAIRFRYNKKSEVLEAVADSILIIENKALGYRIKYQMERFIYNTQTTSLSYSGYPLFEEMGRRRARHQKNRKKAYYGSVMHLVRSLYANRLQQEGFEVRQLHKTPNYEKQRVNALMQKRLNGNAVTDSAAYYRQVMQQPDYFETAGSSLLTADSLVTGSENPGYKIFSFSGVLLLVYKNEPISEEYRRAKMFRNIPKYQTTRLYFENGFSRAEIEANGNYYSPVDLFTDGYMGFGKTGDLLPLDYEPAAED